MSEVVSRLRELAGNGRGAEPTEESCDLCGADLAEDHRHLLHLEERRILCACEPCVAMRSGDGPYRPTGSRLLWFEGFQLSEELWASLRIPIGLAFFMRSSSAQRVVGLYPSPAGATESLLALETWNEIVCENPALAEMEHDVEALLVNRVGSARGFSTAEYYLLPIDECYKLVGVIRAHWRGFSGGTEVWQELARFFRDLKAKATVRQEANA